MNFCRYFLIHPQCQRIISYKDYKTLSKWLHEISLSLSFSLSLPPSLSLSLSLKLIHFICVSIEINSSAVWSLVSSSGKKNVISSSSRLFRYAELVPLAENYQPASVLNFRIYNARCGYIDRTRASHRHSPAPSSEENISLEYY